jgi:hypothetical protein
MSEENPQEVKEPNLIDEMEDLDIEDIIPKMTVDQSLMSPQEKECIVGDDTLLDLYKEILENCRNDRESVDEALTNFLDMVLNEGDASSASKEAIVNLLKIKSDTSDKMAKVADLMTRVKLKEKDTFPRYLAAQQNNKVVIEGTKREMIKKLQKVAANKKVKKNEQEN